MARAKRQRDLLDIVLKVENSAFALFCLIAGAFIDYSQYASRPVFTALSVAIVVFSLGFIVMWTAALLFMLIGVSVDVINNRHAIFQYVRAKYFFTLTTFRHTLNCR